VRFTASVIEGPDLGLAFPVTDIPQKIGKGTACDVVLTDSAVSQTHLELRAMGPLVHVRDLKSTNGTFVGAERLQDKTVVNGTIVKIGRTRLLLRGEAVAPAQPPKPRSGPIPNLATPPDAAAGTRLPYKEARELALNSFERSYLEAAFARNGGNLSLTAQDIGLTRHYLRKLLREHGLIARRPAGRPPRPK
jgi:pSer/pThr/pTyr-binding forkhead associated (FHA) protein